jgi:hypothetical protein
MSHAQDPLLEPLRLLRETNLTAGFDERLALRLTAAHHDEVAPVVRLPSRRRTLLLVAAIFLPAAAAAASGYWLQRHLTASASGGAATKFEAKQLDHLPRIVFTANHSITAPISPVIERLPDPRPRDVSRTGKSDVRSQDKVPATSGAAKSIVAAPISEAPRIESLDPFVPRTSSSAKTTTLPKTPGASESLRKATEQGASRTSDDKGRGSRREATSNENRGNDAAGQARERVQARERKGQ